AGLAAAADLALVDLDGGLPLIGAFPEARAGDDEVDVARGGVAGDAGGEEGPLLLDFRGDAFGDVDPLPFVLGRAEARRDRQTEDVHGDPPHPLCTVRPNLVTKEPLSFVNGRRR